MGRSKRAKKAEAVVARLDDLAKPESDPKTYRWLRLANRLSASSSTTVGGSGGGDEESDGGAGDGASDDEADDDAGGGGGGGGGGRAAAALAVAAGCWDDPPGGGLAHFCGACSSWARSATENAYDAFLQRHGGSDSRHRGGARSTADVRPRGCGRRSTSSRPSSAPLFRADAVGRELASIDAEFALTRRGDGARREEVLGARPSRRARVAQVRLGQLRGLRDAPARRRRAGAAADAGAADAAGAGADAGAAGAAAAADAGAPLLRALRGWFDRASSRARCGCA